MSPGSDNGRCPVDTLCFVNENFENISHLCTKAARNYLNVFRLNYWIITMANNSLYKNSWLLVYNEVGARIYRQNNLVVRIQQELPFFILIFFDLLPWYCPSATGSHLYNLTMDHLFAFSKLTWTYSLSWISVSFLWFQVSVKITRNLLD